MPQRPKRLVERGQISPMRFDQKFFQRRQSRFTQKFLAKNLIQKQELLVRLHERIVASKKELSDIFKAAMKTKKDFLIRKARGSTGEIVKVNTRTKNLIIRKFKRENLQLTAMLKPSIDRAMKIYRGLLLNLFDIYSEGYIKSLAYQKSWQVSRLSDFHDLEETILALGKLSKRANPTSKS